MWSNLDKSCQKPCFSCFQKPPKTLNPWKTRKNVFFVTAKWDKNQKNPKKSRKLQKMNKNQLVRSWIGHLRPTFHKKSKKTWKKITENFQNKKNAFFYSTLRCKVHFWNPLKKNKWKSEKVAYTHACFLKSLFWRFLRAAEIFAKKTRIWTPNFSLCKNPKKTRFSTILKKMKWDPSRILLKISGFFQKNTFFWTKYPV